MKKQNQIKILIIFCLITLAGLISIQYYLIRNTYKLNSETYVNEVKKEISPVVESPEMDSIEEQFISKVKMLCLEKMRDSIHLGEFRNKLDFIADSVRKVSMIYLQSQFKDYPILEEIRLRTKLTQIIFQTNGDFDTILNLSDQPIIFLGENFEGNAFKINTGTTHSSVDTENNSLNTSVKYFYKHNQSTEMDISGFQQIIWKKMMWMLIAAVGLILAVIVLFFRMYRSLIKQKKIAEVKTDFANNITHELKTPLTSLNLIVKSLQKDKSIQNSDSAISLISTLERQNQRIQNIVERIIQSSLGNQQYKFKNLNIAQFLREITSDFNSSTHQLTTEIEPENLMIKTDAYQLERVIQNLLENAVKYSPDSNRIFLKSYVKNRSYIIEITDSGKGIPASEQKRIFEKFYRVSEGNKHEVKGLGLGLYLCKQIIEKLNGKIYVQSALKKGSTFIIKIPVD